MLKRQRWKIAALAVIVLCGALFCPVLYWKPYGWVRGEQLWAGRPTSFWRQEAQGRAFTVRQRKRGGDIAVKGRYVFDDARAAQARLSTRLRAWLDTVTGGLVTKLSFREGDLWDMVS